MKCPNCGSDTSKSLKTWKYGVFTVDEYICENCQTRFREYSKEGKHAFMLKHIEGKRWSKP